MTKMCFITLSLCMINKTSHETNKQWVRYGTNKRICSLKTLNASRTYVCMHDSNDTIESIRGRRGANARLRRSEHMANAVMDAWMAAAELEDVLEP